MKTNFTADQRSNSLILMMEENLRKCVHCGFCLPFCPTYSVLGDERDSPRGRIYLIKDMLEKDDAPSKETITHVDRCLSCLACMPACPSGVNYQHYIDYARNHIENNYRRPWFERIKRAFLVYVITRANLFRIALRVAILAKPFSHFLSLKLSAMINMAPIKLKSPKIINEAKVYPAIGVQIKRVTLLMGCAQNVLRPSINEATISLLTRMGMEVVVSKDVGCCGALSHHLGDNAITQDLAKVNIDAWLTELDQRGLDNIVINSAGCGTHVKDYAYILNEDPVYKEKAKRISELTKDISELISEHQLPNVKLSNPPNIIYHDACSLMHGQGITLDPREQLETVGFEVLEIPGRHYCCGSAGIYNLLEPKMASELKARRLSSIEEVSNSFQGAILATGNIGCLMQLATGANLQVFHTVELLDWATGGLELSK
ncbi:MAG: glycolate oxidase subunit GlcF [Pseudomonadota bacterium]|nr:glycolate oxidase subunit GlcF [Pseudomonadota bacterium]